MPRVTFHLGRWIRSTDWYPNYQLRLYDRRRARWTGRYVHESVKADGPVDGSASGEILHYAYRDLAHHFQTMDRYTTLAARQMFEDGRRAGLLDLAVHPPAAFLRNYLLRGGFRDGVPGLIVSAMNARYVGPEVCQTLGAVFALHIDTARTWRGGQQQVLLTVLGLRARGHRAVLVAHPEGELYRRASEGADLLPLAPKNEVDLATAWKLSRIIRQWKPAIVHAHDPHAVVDGRPGAVVWRADAAAEDRRVAPGGLPPAGAFVLAVEVPAGGRLHRGLAVRFATFSCTTSIPAARIASCTTASISRGSSSGRRSTSTPSTGCRTARRSIVNVGALVGHKGQRHLVDAMPLVMREVPDAHLVIFGEGELRAPLETADQASRARKAHAAAGLSRGRAVAREVGGSVRDELGDRGARLGGARRDGDAAGRRRHAAPAAFPRRWCLARPGVLVEPGEPKPLAAAIVKLLKNGELRRAYGEAGCARVRDLFGVDRLVEGTLAAYHRFTEG